MLRILLLLPCVLLLQAQAVISSAAAAAAIQVIGAGLGRTGTLSLSQALEVLGYKPYHFVDLSHAKHWYEVAQGLRSVDSIIDRIVQEGYTATLDNPAADIYLPLFQRFPDAKVILTVRDSSTEFANSWKVLYESLEVTERDFRGPFRPFFSGSPPFGTSNGCAASWERRI